MDCDTWSTVGKVLAAILSIGALVVGVYLFCELLEFIESIRRMRNRQDDFMCVGGHNHTELKNRLKILESKVLKGKKDAKS